MRWTRPFSPAAWAVALAATVAVTAGCGGGDICLNCNPSGSPTPSTDVTVAGNVVFVDEGQIPGLVVTICANETSASDPSSCASPLHATVDINGDFVRTGVPPGSEQIFFSTEPEGEPGTLSAKLLDPDGVLERVSAGFTVDAVNVEVAFLRNVASADQIVVAANPTPTPTPRPTTTATPTPSPTPR